MVVLLTALVSLTAPAASLAQDAKAPPGLSGADEYLETVPNAGGNGTVGNGQRPNGEDPSVAAATKAALPAVTINALGRAGNSGKDAAALAGRTAPAAPRNGSAPLSSTPLQDPAASGPLAAAGRIVTGSGGGGMGVLFPLLLIAGTLAVAGAALWRRRDATA